MRPDRLLLLACTLTAACRRDPPPAAPRPTPLDVPQVRVPADVPTDRPSRGLVATLMSCSPATRTGPDGPWTVSLRLTVHNQSTSALPLRREGFRVTVDESVRGDLSAPDAVEGPAEIPPRGRETVILHPRFPTSASAPITVTFGFDSVGGLNHPISFPIPSGP